MPTIENIFGAETDELTYLAQIVDIDGVGATILNSEPIANGSGRVIGETYTVSDENAEWIAECIRAEAVYAH